MRDIERRLKKLEESSKSKEENYIELVLNNDELNFTEKLGRLLDLGVISGEDINRAIVRALYNEAD